MSTNRGEKRPDQGQAAVEAIRSIIFGEQEKFYQEKFQHLEKQLEKLKTDFTTRLKELSDRISADRKEFSSVLEQLKATLDNTDKHLEEKLSEARRYLEARLKELEEKKANRTSLASQLEKLAEYFKNNQ